MNDRQSPVQNGFSEARSFEAAKLRAMNQNEIDWSAARFDEQFLKGRAAPILARFLDGHIAPDPDELAEAWLQQLGIQPKFQESMMIEAVPMATRYLLRLERELRRH